MECYVYVVCTYTKFVDAMIDSLLAIMEQKVLCSTKKIVMGKLGIAQLNVMADT